MDILEPKTNIHIHDKVRNIMKQLEMFNEPIFLKGSASLQSQRYFSDYDLLTNINIKDSRKVFNEFIRIFSKILSNDVYLVEFKIQTKDGYKIRWHTLRDFDFDKFNQVFKNIEFCKIDLILMIDKEFIELSCIYQFNELPTEDYLKSIIEDIKELENDKLYYKILKRKFTIYKSLGDNENLLRLSNIFNSSLGQKYKLLSNLEAIKKILEITDDDATIKKVILNLKEMGQEPNIKLINKNIKELKNFINKAARKLNKHFKI